MEREKIYKVKVKKVYMNITPPPDANIVYRWGERKNEKDERKV